MKPRESDCQQHSEQVCQTSYQRIYHIYNIMLLMHSLEELPDSNNNLEVILQGSFDILLEVKFTSRSQVYLHIMHCQKRKANSVLKEHVL